MRLAAEIRMYARFLAGLRTFLRHTVTPEQARAALARRLADREEALLRFAERGFYGAPRSPYRALLRLARCEPGDLRALVRDRGVEGALLALREAGVYVTFEELKGRRPLVRHGTEIPVRRSDFDNPYLTHYYRNATSGSTGSATRVSTDLDHLALQAEHWLICVEAHGLWGAPWGIWRPPLPAGSGLNTVLRGARIGYPPARWFSPIVYGELAAQRPLLKYRLANRATVELGRAFGARLPRPEPVPLGQAIRVARWMAETRDVHGRVLLNTTVSNGLRVAFAARQAGVDLTGATLMLAGEAATPAKVKGIRASGARHFTYYAAAETGRLAMGCVNPVGENDVHLMLDAFAVVPWQRAVPHSGATVHTFHLTAFAPTAPKLLLNAEFDDFGIVEERACGCPLEALGLRVHLRDIRSFGKLTGEGMTLVGSDMERILEEVLPGRFGGSPLDYQVREEEDAEGFTRLTLVVSPSVEVPDESALVELVLSALPHAGVGADLVHAFWRQAGAFRVERAQPYASVRGKQALLHTVRVGSGLEAG